MNKEYKTNDVIFNSELNSYKIVINDFISNDINTWESEVNMKIIIDDSNKITDNIKNNIGILTTKLSECITFGSFNEPKLTCGENGVYELVQKTGILIGIDQHVREE